MNLELNEQQKELLKFLLERTQNLMENYSETTKKVALQILNKLEK